MLSYLKSSGRDPCQIIKDPGVWNLRYFQDILCHALSEFANSTPLYPQAYVWPPREGATTEDYRAQYFLSSIVASNTRRLQELGIRFESLESLFSLKPEEGVIVRRCARLWLDAMSGRDAFEESQGHKHPLYAQFIAAINRFALLLFADESVYARVRNRDRVLNQVFNLLDS